MKNVKLVIISALLLFPFTSHAIKVVDGDTLELNDARISLLGIDAPEFNQNCKRYGKKHPCGKEAKEKLKELISDKTQCVIKGVDERRRILSICYNGKTNINAEMVKEGYALAFRSSKGNYIKEEYDAKKHRRGIWKGNFEQRPEYYQDYRR